MKPLDRDSLREIWSVLDTPHDAELETFPLSDFFAHELRLGVDRLEARHLIVSTEAPKRPWSIGDSPLRDTVRDLSFSTSGRYLDIACTDSELFDVFDELLLDVLPSAGGSVSPGSEIQEALSSWRRLFKAARMAGLSRPRRFGVFAELYVLRSAAQLVGPAALDYWSGPDQHPHDFEFPNGCLEVKGVGETSTWITFHGLKQLERHDNRTLAIAVIELVESLGGLTTNGLLTEIRELVGVDALDAKLGQLGLQGWRDQHDPLGVSGSFVVRFNEDLPRIDTSSPKGSDRHSILRVEYDVDLASFRSRNVSDSLESTVARLLEDT